MLLNHYRTCWLLVIVMVFSPSLVASAPPTLTDQSIHSVDNNIASSKEEEDKSEAESIDLSYVSSTAFAMAVVYPRRVLTSPQHEMLPTEVMTAVGIQEVGIDPMDIEQISSFVEPNINPHGPPDLGIVFHFAKAYDIDDVFMPLHRETQREEHNGLPLYLGNRPDVPSYYMPDDRTLLFGTRGALRSMMEGGTAEGSVADRLQEMAGCDIALAVEVAPIRPLLLAALKEAPPLPAPFEAVFDLPEQIAAVQLGLSLTGSQPSQIEIIATSEEAAEQIEAFANQAIDLGSQLALVEMQKQFGDSEDPIEQASIQYAERLTAMFSEMARPERDGDRLSYRTSEDLGHLNIATVGVLVALLLPAVTAARAAAQRMNSLSNLKNISLAFLNYESATSRFPARAILDDDGKPLLSWRVQILPYLEESLLYDEFHLDEPWDSEHNLQLVERMPSIYASPGHVSKGRTHYQLPIGEGTPFEFDEGLLHRSLTDGTSKTILAVEADAFVIWTKPADWEVDFADPLSGVGNVREEGFNAVFADGSVHFIANDIDPETLRALLTIEGNEVIGDF